MKLTLDLLWKTFIYFLANAGINTFLMVCFMIGSGVAPFGPGRLVSIPVTTSLLFSLILLLPMGRFRRRVAWVLAIMLPIWNVTIFNLSYEDAFKTALEAGEVLAVQVQEFRQREGRWPTGRKELARIAANATESLDADDEIRFLFGDDWVGTNVHGFGVYYTVGDATPLLEVGRRDRRAFWNWKESGWRDELDIGADH